MKGSETLLLGFMEGAANGYVVPVYQRNYDWKKNNCDISSRCHPDRGSCPPVPPYSNPAGIGELRLP